MNSAAAKGIALDRAPDNVPAPAAVTMDVFDTAVTRCWAHPQHVFLACAQRLRSVGLIDMPDEAWMHERQRAEASVTNRLGADMATLAAIYDALVRVVGWTSAQTEVAIAIEIDTELDSVRPVPRTLDFCRQLGRTDTPLRYLSDMYLPEPAVTQLLAHAGYAVDADQVWVSSQRSASKRQGRLFDLALAAWQPLRATQVLHVGDNTVSDVQRARSAGLRALHLEDTRLPRSALHLLDVDTAPLPLRSLVAGAMRLAALNAPALAARHEGLWQLGACHAGPMLTQYVWWLLAHAQTHGVRRLYFLARDGQVLLDIAQALQTAGVGAGIELRYLHASRQAWFAPSLTQWNEAALFRLLDEPDRLSDPAKLARRLGLADAEALHARWPRLTGALRTGLNNREVAQLLVTLVPAEDALLHTARLRHDTLDYLNQHGLFDGVPWAIVDLGWRGRMQECLARIVQCHPQGAGVSAAGYYLGLSEPPRDMPNGWRVHALFPPGDGTRWPGPAHLIEMLCEATHGSTRGYVRGDDGAVRAVFDEQAARAMSDWGLPIYRQAVRCYATQLAASLPLLNPAEAAPAHLRALSLALGRELFGRPEPAVARAFAHMPCSHSIDHDAGDDLAPPIGVLDAWCRALSLGRLRLSRQVTNWLPGSLARTHAAAYGAHVRLHRFAERLRQRLRDLRAADSARRFTSRGWP